VCDSAGRRTSDRTRITVAVCAAVAAGAALLLVNPRQAGAATTQTWDRLAQCESGGDWSADTGNDRYGGLQLSAHTWKYYGGIRYTERPDEATRPEQILVAQRLLEDASWKPWPVCSRRLHLTSTEAMGTPDVTDTTPPTVTPVPTPTSSPSSTPDPVPRPTAAADRSATPTAAPTG
jgi:hypothetical protein